nr:hypothetical protein [Nanoarchaeum sp.]
MELNEDLAELIGAHVGDGTLYKTNSKSIVWELRGDLKEKEYYTENICPLIKRLFDIQLNSKFRSGGKNGCWGVQTCNKQIINTFLEYGFVSGNKTYTVSVPNYIFDSRIEIKRAFIRGLFDTDGCLNFYKINNNLKRDYPRIIFSSASVNLRDSLNTLLQEMGFKTSIWNAFSFSVCISGKETLLRWAEEIKPRNPKFLKKVNDWKNKGFY